MTRTIAYLFAAALLTAACSTDIEGVPMANDAPPQDVWQLADQLTQRVPLTEEKFADLLGTPLSPNPQNPLRLEGGVAQLSPELTVTSSVIAIIDGTWSFAAIDVEPSSCITEEMVKEHYPSVELIFSPRGHSPMEEFVWGTTYEWGQLRFGIREKSSCLTGISVERAK